jgi:hypothetical protein
LILVANFDALDDLLSTRLQTSADPDRTSFAHWKTSAEIHSGDSTANHTSRFPGPPARHTGFPRTFTAEQIAFQQAAPANFVLIVTPEIA